MMYTDKQQIFDIVLAGITAQNAFARDNNGCRYRTKNGLKCAAGMLIPDDIYQASMESLSVGVIGHKYDLWPEEFNLFVRRLQRMHDMHSEAGGDFIGWRQKMAEFAYKNGLKYAG